MFLTAENSLFKDTYLHYLYSKDKIQAVKKFFFYVVAWIVLPVHWSSGVVYWRSTDSLQIILAMD